MNLDILYKRKKVYSKKEAIYSKKIILLFIFLYTIYSAKTKKTNTSDVQNVTDSSYFFWTIAPK